jgi:hypothetical protein
VSSLSKKTLTHIFQAYMILVMGEEPTLSVSHRNASGRDNRNSFIRPPSLAATPQTSFNRWHESKDKQGRLGFLRLNSF